MTDAGIRMIAAATARAIAARDLERQAGSASIVMAGQIDAPVNRLTAILPKRHLRRLAFLWPPDGEIEERRFG
jgi:hypothetical protein